MKKNLLWRGGESNSGPLGYELSMLPQSYRYCDMKMFKINEYVLSLSN